MWLLTCTCPVCHYVSAGFLTVPHAEQVRCCERSPRAWNHAIWSSIVPASTLDRSSIFMLAHTALVGPTEYTVVLPRLSLPRLHSIGGEFKFSGKNSRDPTRAGGETSWQVSPTFFAHDQRPRTFTASNFELYIYI